MIFSVVVTHYKQPKYWEEAAVSVLKQDYPALQLIVSDDGTPGFLVEKAQAFLEENLPLRQGKQTELLVRRNYVNMGTAANTDNALACCRGEYVLFLDGDDVLQDETVLTNFARKFEQLPEKENIIAANCLMCDAQLENGKLRYTDELAEELNQETLEQQRMRLYTNTPFPVPSATAYKRRVFSLVGGFKVPYIRLCQDGYMFMRLTRLRQRFNVAGFVAAKHRAGGVCNPVSPEKKVPTSLSVEFMRICEAEVFPYLLDCSQECIDETCYRYYQNIISYRIASNDLSYGISEPAYTIMKDWADRRGDIPWYFSQSKLHYPREDMLWQLNKCKKGIQLTRREDCCGCTACAAICPQNAIQMCEDEQGFFYPSVDAALCVDCGNCTAVCPIANKKAETWEPLEYFAAKHQKASVRRLSRSGGAFAAVAEKLLQNGGVVYGAAYDENLRVRHIRIASRQELWRLQGVKYVQSRLDGCLAMVAEDLNAKKAVLFSGTPCQVGGLLQFLKGAHVSADRLLTMDIVCHGTPSPLVYERYLDYWERKLKAPISEFDFRDKDHGWRGHEESLTIEANRTKKKKYSRFYRDLFYQHNMLRPACYCCPFACYERSADITVADYWGVEKHCPDFDDDKGVSLVMPHTSKGQACLNSVRDQFETRALSKGQTLQPNLEAPSAKGEGYEEFWRDMRTCSMEELLEKWGGAAKVKHGGQKQCHTVGILTFHRAHNYGAMLQAWALMQYLRQMGCDVHIVDYRCKRIESSYQWLPWQITPKFSQFIVPSAPMRGIRMYFSVWLNLRPTLRAWHKRRQKFNEFLRKDLGVLGKGYRLGELDNLPYDAVVCGSDQIWVVQDAPYYAAFEGKMRRIAYAASYGNRPFPPEFHPTVYPWLKNFDFISVREKGMVSDLKAAFDVTPNAVTLDPTLLLDAETYTPLLDENSPLCQRQYLLCYCVLEDDTMVELAQQLAAQEELELIVIRHFLRNDAKNQIQEVEAGPREFLNYIKWAQYVVTNSFHGTVFSILFDRKFYAVYQDGKNDRIEELLNALGLLSCHLTDALPKTPQNVSRKDVMLRLDQLRDESYRFLGRALQ